MPPRLPPVIRRLARSRGGVIIIEYALLLALISVAAVTVLESIGQPLRNMLTATSGALS
jgi:Flp pilus assembly pilin Flp